MTCAGKIAVHVRNRCQYYSYPLCNIFFVSTTPSTYQARALTLLVISIIISDRSVFRIQKVLSQKSYECYSLNLATTIVVAGDYRVDGESFTISKVFVEFLTMCDNYCTGIYH